MPLNKGFFKVYWMSVFSLLERLLSVKLLTPHPKGSLLENPYHLYFLRRNKMTPSRKSSTQVFGMLLWRNLSSFYAESYNVPNVSNLESQKSLRKLFLSKRIG